MADDKKLKWTTVQRKLGDLIPYPKNPRRMTEKQEVKLNESIIKFDLVEIPAINTDDMVIAGHQRIKLYSLIYPPETVIDVRLPNRKLTKKEFEEYNIRSNANTGEWDTGLLTAQWDRADLKEWGIDEELYTISDIKEIETFNTNVNFIIECANIKELDILKQRYGGQKIKYSDYIAKSQL
jgi:hypothetical protein